MYSFSIKYREFDNKLYMIGMLDGGFTRYMEQHTKPTRRQMRRFKSNYHCSLELYF